MTARVGLIIPSSNRMVEQEMVGHFPPGVQAHVMRLRMTGAHRLPLDELLPRVEEAARALVDARCEVVVFHCTANSMADGLDGERRLLDAVMRAGAPQAATTATAIRGAFAAIGARRIVLLTPYGAQTTEKEAEFLHTAGYEVVQATGFALKGSDEYCATPAQFWRDRAIEAARPEADAYLISCANISIFAVIDEIEARLGRPVVTSNQVVIWQSLSQVGWRGRGKCPGGLFDTLGEAASPAAAPDPLEVLA
jgi:maleate isomerase